MKYENYIFDLYGTLVDIHTDEEKTELWEKLAQFYGYYGAVYTAEELKNAYACLTGQKEDALRQEMGSDAAIEAADIVLMDDDPMKIVKAIKIARKCIRIVYENIYFAIGIKVICLILGALGIANMWAAIFADVGVMVIAVLNAIRALSVKKL